ncbi:MAG TPA: NrsF family protein [Polyangiaceae bacterium]|nr:NrsF family protein [Polyangiaceae bacterium]
MNAEPQENPDFGDIPDVRLAAPPGLEPPAALRAREPLKASPTRADLQRRRWIALGIAVLWALVELGAFGVRFDLGKLSASYIALTCGLPFVLGAAGLVAAVKPGSFGLGLQRRSLLVLLALGVLVVVVTAFAVPEPYTDGIDGGGRSIFMCGHLALSWAAVPLLAAALALRGSLVGSTVVRSALIGTVCGLGAAVAAQIRCPVTGAAHIALAHGGVVVIAALLGALLLPRLTEV